MARILYVGSSSKESGRLRSLLEQKGHSVQVVDCAERAMLYVDREGDYEALVLHLYLPGMDGAELCRWVERRSSLKGIPKVAFTWAGLRMPVDVSQGLPKWLPVDRYIEGLERVEELVEAVEGLLAARRRDAGTPA